jgi:hypothetical protein
MRIIPDNVHVSYAVIDQGQNYSSGNPMYHQDQTIEITDDDINKIKLEYDNYIDRQLKWIGQDLGEGKITENEMFDKFSSLPKFSQYLKDLICLVR